MKTRKPTTEFRWEAYDPATGAVAKRGPIRDDLAKVEKYKREIEIGIIDGTLAPYWNNLQLRIVTRTITPWELHEDLHENLHTGLRTETEPTTVNV